MNLNQALETIRIDATVNGKTFQGVYADVADLIERHVGTSMDDEDLIMIACEAVLHSSQPQSVRLESGRTVSFKIA